MADRKIVNQKRKAIRVQATAAELAAEIKATSKKLGELAIMADKAVGDQRQVMSRAGNSAPLTLNRKKRAKANNKGVVHATVAAASKLLPTIGLMLFLGGLGISATPLTSTAAPLLCSLAGSKLNLNKPIMKEISKLTSFSQLKLERVEKLDQKLLSDLKELELEWADVRLALDYCTAPAIETSIVAALKRVASNNIQDISAHMNNLEECRQTYKRQIELLKSQNSKFNSIKIDSENLQGCRKQLGLANEIWNKVVLHRHDAHSHVEADFHNHTSLGGCDEVEHWREWGYLANGGNDSCTRGLVSAYDLHNSHCIKNVAVNVNEPSKHCGLGFRRFRGSENRYHVATTGDKVSCSMGCFSLEELFESSTNQPMCLSCLTPYAASLWDLRACGDHEIRAAITISDITIYSDRTEFVIGGKVIVSRNSWTFSSCCGGRGPTSDNKMVYKDKWCACDLKKAPLLPNAIKDLFTKAITMMSAHWIVWICSALLLSLNPRLTILAGVIWFLYQFNAVTAACNLDNSISPNAVSGRWSTTKGTRFDLTIAEGQCLVIGPVSIEFNAIFKTYVYRFEKTVPYKTKMVCAKLDWACWGGSQSELLKRPNECSNACGIGIVDTKTTVVPAFHGSGCAAFWEGVMMRHDVCLSIGSLGTQVRFYKHVNYIPETTLDVTIYRVGVDVGVRSRISSKTFNNEMKILNTIDPALSFPKVLAQRGPINFCSMTTVEVDKLCGSVDLTQPLKIDSLCYGINHAWAPHDSSYAISYKNKDAERIIHDDFHECGVGSNVSFSAYEATLDRKIHSATFEIETKYEIQNMVESWCPLGQIIVDNKPGVTGFRSTTVIELESSFIKECDVEVDFEGCLPMQGALVRLHSDRRQRLEYYCRGNASRTFILKSDNDKKAIDIANVKKNWAPLNQEAYNTIIKSSQAVSPGAWAKGVFHWFGSIDLTRVFTALSSFLTFGWYKMVFALLLGFIMVQSVQRGNLYNVALCGAIFYIVFLTDLVASVKVDLTHPVVVSAKLIRCNTCWFFAYNLPDWYVIADILEVVIYGLMFYTTVRLAGFVAALVTTQMIKGIHRVLSNTKYSDSIVVVGVDLRLPYISQVSRRFLSKRVKVENSYDIFDETPSLDKKTDIRGVVTNLRHVYCNDSSDASPVPWSVASRFILCSEHSNKGVNSVPIGGGYLSWEWHHDRLCIYISAHVVTPPSEATRIYGDVFVATHRSTQKKLTPTFVSVTDRAIRVADHRLIKGKEYLNPKGFSGSVLLGNKGHYYVIHEADEEGRLIEREMESEPSGPFEFVASCSSYESARDGSGSDTGSMEDESEEEAGASSRPVRDMGPASLPEDVRMDLPPSCRYEGVAQVQEWEDYWGTKYTKYQYNNFSFLRCRDTPLYAAHTYDEEALNEIYPDVGTTLNTMNVACSSVQSDCVYTHVDTGRCLRPADRQVFFIRRGAHFFAMNCLVVKTSERLMSGQCIYHWTQGWCAYYKDNVRVAGVVTVARKIGDYWYSAVVNGSSDICKFKLDGPNLYKTEYIRTRDTSGNRTMVRYYETQEFKGNRIMRLLCRDRKIVASWIVSNAYEYKPNEWEYCAIKTVRYSPFVRGVVDDLATRITSGGGIVQWIRSVEKDFLAGPDCLSSEVAPMVCFSTTARIQENVCRVKIEVSHDLVIREMSNAINIKAPSNSLLEVSGKVNKYLWTCGFEVITYTGDLLALTRDPGQDVGLLFDGCTIAVTPCIWFMNDDHNVLNELKNWLIVQESVLGNAIVGATEMVVHPDWRVGAAKLAPEQCKSLAEGAI